MAQIKEHSTSKVRNHFAGHEATGGDRSMIIQPGRRQGAMLANGAVPPHPYKGYRTPNGGTGSAKPGKNCREGKPAGVDGGVTKKGND